VLGSLPHHPDGNSRASAPANGVAVELEDLAKHYGDVHALDGVSLQTASGEIFGLLGHNGAGKSTMIRILTGRAKPTRGRATVLGHEVPRDLEAVRGEINLVA
jgi:ABC-2 type transport system ATP-binding protein